MPRDICSVLRSSRNFWRTPLTSWYAATPRSTTPATPTSKRPAGQSKTPAVVWSGFDDAPFVVEPEKDLDRRDGQGAVDEPAPQAPEPVERAVGRLGPVTERGSEQTPDRVAAQPDREHDEEEAAERLVGDRAQRALLVRELPRVAHRDLECEDADDRVDQASRYEAGPREDLEGRRVDDVAACTANGLDGRGVGHARHREVGIPAFRPNDSPEPGRKADLRSAAAPAVPRGSSDAPIESPPCEESVCAA